MESCIILLQWIKSMIEAMTTGELDLLNIPPLHNILDHICIYM